MSPSMLALLLVSLSLTTVTARFFSLRLSLPSSSDPPSFALCISQVGSPDCSILSERDVFLDGLEMDVDFIANASRSSIQQHLTFSSTLSFPSLSSPLRRRTSLRLSLNREKQLWIAPGMEMKATLRCRQHYYGASCSVRCVPSDHTRCDEVGRVACAPGWIGEGCATQINHASTTVVSSTVIPTASIVIAEKSDNSDQLIIICMIVVVCLCLVVLYSVHQMSAAVSALAAPQNDRLRTHLTTLEGSDAEDGLTDASLLFQAACDHVRHSQPNIDRDGSDSVLSYVSALDDKTYAELYSHSDYHLPNHFPPLSSYFREIPNS